MYWRGLYLSSDGRLRKTASEFSEHRRQSQQREAELQAQIDALRAGSSPPAVDLSGYFTPEQIERFGEDQCRIMVTAAQKAAGETVAQQVERHVKPLVQARQDDAARAAEDAKARFHAELDQLLPPDWRDIDRQQPWLDWLAQLDVSTGQPRGEILQYHAGRLDAQRAAQMMLAYLNAQKPPAPPAPPAPPVTPSGSGASGAGSPPPPPAPVGGAPSKAEIQEFYKRAALGKVSAVQRADFEARLRSLRAA